MENNNTYELWFVTGSQHLYGKETLKKVSADAEEIANALNNENSIPVSISFKPIVTTPDEIYNTCREANASPACIGVITWMHTFSPAKMWISGLKILHKPVVHLHTQFNREIPWNDIDMDFMNLNQSAHGGREFGYLMSRMRIERKIIVGHWKDESVIEKLQAWCRAAMAWHDMQNARVVRFGDNMREVAVTDGDKVEAQVRFGYDVLAYGVGELAEAIQNVTDSEASAMVQEYLDTYIFKEDEKEDLKSKLLYHARIEIAMENFLKEGDFKAFTTNFEDLSGVKQLPGLAVQRLMQKGYGFGAEGDWKTAALLRAFKVMGAGLPGGESFMEDYTYHFEKGNGRVLGAHMLEVCPSIASDKPNLEIHPLSIGGKDDPARLVFDVAPGPALNASLMDMGNRFRLLVNEVEAVACNPLPKLPVARVLWDPKPDLNRAAEAWIRAGGAHHTVFSKSVSTQTIKDFAEIAGIEFLLIDKETKIDNFEKEIRWNEMYYMMNRALYK